MYIHTHTHLAQVNRKERGHDINVTDVWLEGVTGRGVVIAVVDDGEFSLGIVLMLLCNHQCVYM